MNEQSPNRILAEMTPRERCLEWHTEQKQTNKRLLRNTAFFAAVSLCLGISAIAVTGDQQKSETVISRLTAGFEYDETIGRLQLVSSILPESAMVFLSNDHTLPDFSVPTDASIVHAWSQQEPWIEFSGPRELSACLAGEVITLVSNRAGDHTIRIMHDNGYESIYSGIKTVSIKEYDHVETGQLLGISGGNSAFEIRKDGVAVLPVFSER